MQNRQLTSRIKIIDTTTAEDERGGTSVSSQADWTVWAEAKAGSGRSAISDEQVAWNYDFKFYIRFYKTKLVNETMQVEFKGCLYSIRSISLDNEVQPFYQILTCDKVQNVN